MDPSLSENLLGDSDIDLGHAIDIIDESRTRTDTFGSRRGGSVSEASVTQRYFNFPRDAINNFTLVGSIETHGDIPVEDRTHVGTYKGQVEPSPTRGTGVSNANLVACGRGKFRSSDGYEYIGEFEHNKPNGFGTEHFSDGIEWNGIRENGVFKRSSGKGVGRVKATLAEIFWDTANSNEWGRHAKTEMRTLEQRYNDGKADAMEAMAITGSIPLLEDPKNQIPISVLLTVLGTTVIVVAVFVGMMSAPWSGEGNAKLIQIQNVLMCIEGIIWLGFVFGPVLHRQSLQKLRWLSAAMLLEFLQGLYIGVLLASGLLKDVTPGRRTATLFAGLVLPATMMITLFNVNFLKHLITNFRAKKAVAALLNDEQEYLDITDFPSKTVYMFGPMSIALLGVGVSCYIRDDTIANNDNNNTTNTNTNGNTNGNGNGNGNGSLVDDDNTSDTFTIGNVFAIGTGTIMVLVSCNLIGKVASKWWGESPKGRISWFIYMNNIFTGLYGGVAFAAYLCLGVFLLDPRRRIEKAEGFAIILFVSATTSLIACGFLFVRFRQAVEAAQKLVAADKKAHDVNWENIKQTNAAGIKTLLGLLEKIKTSTSAPVQFKSHGKTRGASGKYAVVQGFELYRKVFDASEALNPIAQAKIKAIVNAQGHAQEQGRQHNTGIVYKSAPLKTHTRAIEKVWRSYNGEPDRLVDIVRGSIVCDDISQVADVLRSIHEDPEIQILRWKNRFNPDNDAKETAGYRDFALNCLLQNTDTVNHPHQLDRVVFELQIQIWSIFKLKSDKGHYNYVRFRNFRAL